MAFSGPARAGRPIYARGSWTADTTFTLDYDEGPGLATYTIEMRFDDGSLTFEVRGVGALQGHAPCP